jgi:hypothetical protein
MLFFNSVFNNALKSIKCPICALKFSSEAALIKHVLNIHGNLIPEGKSVEQWLYDLRHDNKEHWCQICKINKCVWNPKKNRYSAICDDPQCKAEMRRRFLERYKKKNGKDHDISDPDVQKEMLFRKKNSGEYTFKNGNKIRYMSQYEKDFLKLLDLDLNWPLEEDTLTECDIYFRYSYNGKPKVYIPDYYIPCFDLIIEIKSQENKHPKLLAVDRELEKLKDEAVRKDGTHNFIKIVDKNYTDFISLFETLKTSHLSDKIKKGDKIIIIPEYKNPTGDFKMPPLNFIHDEKAIFSLLMQEIYHRSYSTKLQLIIDKELVEEDYKHDHLLTKDKTVLREAELNMDDRPKVIQFFKECAKYYTKTYEKFIDQDFLSIVGLIDTKKWKLIHVLIDNNKKRFEILEKLMAPILTKNVFFLTIETKIGFDVITRNIKNNALNKVISQDPRHYLLSLDKNYYPIPGSIQAGFNAFINENYSSLIDDNKDKKENIYKGWVIEESLTDKSWLSESSVNIIQTKEDEDWHIHTVETDYKMINEISYILDNLYYADFIRKKEHVIVFREKIFKAERGKPDSYKEAIEYGKKMGIPEEQLDFYHEDEDDTKSKLFYDLANSRLNVMGITPFNPTPSGFPYICGNCGRAAKPLGDDITTAFGKRCPNHPEHKHILSPTPGVCRYCGRETRSVGTKLITIYGENCKNGPGGKHSLN